jgi:hypothetical protein
VPRLCGLYLGICLTTEEKGRKNLGQGSRRVPAGTMKIHKHTIRNIGKQLRSDAASHPRRTEKSCTALPKTKISQHTCIIHRHIKFHMASSIILLIFDSEVLYTLINTENQRKLENFCAPSLFIFYNLTTVQNYFHRLLAYIIP